MIFKTRIIKLLLIAFVFLAIQACEKDTKKPFEHVSTDKTAPWQNNEDGYHDYYPYGRLISFKDKLWAIGIANKDSKIWSSNDGIEWDFEKNGPWSPSNFLNNPTTLVFNDKIWLLGKEIWNSDDGLTWKLINDDSPLGYTNLLHNLCQVFDNKIFVFVGQMHLGYKVLSSTDGVEWNVENDEGLWGTRFNSSTFVFQDSLWICGGVDEVEGRDYNDIWNSADGKVWTKLSSTLLERTNLHSCEILGDYVWFITSNGVWQANEDMEMATFEDSSFDLWSTSLSTSFNDKLFIYSSTIDYIQKN